MPKKEIQKLELQVTAETKQAEKSIKELQKLNASLFEVRSPKGKGGKDAVELFGSSIKNKRKLLKLARMQGTIEVESAKKVAEIMNEAQRKEALHVKKLSMTEKRLLGEKIGLYHHMMRSWAFIPEEYRIIDKNHSMFATNAPGSAEIRANIKANRKDIEKARAKRPAELKYNIDRNIPITRENSLYGAMEDEYQESKARRWENLKKQREDRIKKQTAYKVTGKGSFVGFLNKLDRLEAEKAEREAEEARRRISERWENLKKQRENRIKKQTAYRVTGKGSFVEFLKKLDRLDEERAAKRASAEAYRKSLRGISQRDAAGYIKPRQSVAPAVTKANSIFASGTLSPYEIKLQEEAEEKAIENRKKYQLWRERRMKKLEERRAKRAEKEAKRLEKTKREAEAKRLRRKNAVSPFIKMLGKGMLVAGAAMMVQRTLMGIGQSAMAAGMGLAEAEFNESQRKGFMAGLSQERRQGFLAAAERYSQLTGMNKYQSMGEVARFGGIAQSSGLQMDSATMMAAVNASVGLAAQKGSSVDDAMQTLIGVIAGNITPAKAGLQGLRKGATPGETLIRIEKMLKKNQAIERIMQGNTVATSMQRIQSAPNSLMAQIQEKYGDQMARFASGASDWIAALFGEDDPRVADAWAGVMVNLRDFGKALFGDEDSAGKLALHAAKSFAMVFYGMEKIADGIHAFVKSDFFQTIYKYSGYAAEFGIEAVKSIGRGAKNVYGLRSWDSAIDATLEKALEAKAKGATMYDGISLRGSETEIKVRISEGLEAEQEYIDTTGMY
jgi:hypothetical protein